MRQCFVCGSRLTRETITYTQTTDEELHIVVGVEAEVCAQCGEQYLSPDTVNQIQHLIENGQAVETRQVPVYRLPRSAA